MYIHVQKVIIIYKWPEKKSFKINILVTIIVIVGLNTPHGNFGRQKLTKLVVLIKVVELSSVHRVMYIICT